MATPVCCGCHLETDYGTSIVSGDGSQESPYSLIQTDPTFNRPLVRVARGGSQQAIPLATPTPVVFFFTDFDTDGMWNSLLPTRLTVQVSGLYLMGFNGAWGSFANTVRETSFRLNGVSTLDKQSQINNDTVVLSHYYDMTYLWPLVAGDYLEVVAFHQNNPSISMNFPQFWMMYLGKAV